MASYDVILTTLRHDFMAKSPVFEQECAGVILDEGIDCSIPKIVLDTVHADSKCCSP